ncbi:MAG: hypothetical protein UU12_C0023G0017 [Candidatus Woesebacteria bacterium GW2011_GWA2_40_7b]|uniref:Polymerase nucleotidyl transferase domain-containing protein n=1 Tax=Candidatus Woesebacteria bacterium GW2011_GWA2_40_7b TaxID=1618563 RepID=A0A0G0T004_9BACT|nr:MAG: hypothetical protein UU12_C0023G0017 [Candidatus Woesebacteria bacterium GW2011_GWA2_40_7b]
MSDRQSEFEYLQIPENEKNNVDELVSLLKKSAVELKYTIKTKVVGGVVTKKWPRKDIDIVVDIQNKNRYQKNSERVVASFKILTEITDRALRENSRFKIDHSINPHPDPQLGDPEILIHLGTVIIKSMDGVPIELLNNPI